MLSTSFSLSSNAARAGGATLYGARTAPAPVVAAPRIGLIVEAAHKKGSGHSKNGRDSVSKVWVFDRKMEWRRRGMSARARRREGKTWPRRSTLAAAASNYLSKLRHFSRPLMTLISLISPTKRHHCSAAASKFTVGSPSRPEASSSASSEPR